MSKTLDITHERGDSFIRTIRLDGGLLTSAFNEVWFTVRSTLPDGSVSDDSGALSSAKLTTGGITETGMSEWTVTITTPNWTVGKLPYDVQVRTTTGQIFTIIKGTIRVFNDVTRST